MLGFILYAIHIRTDLKKLDSIPDFTNQHTKTVIERLTPF